MLYHTRLVYGDVVCIVTQLFYLHTKVYNLSKEETSVFCEEKRKSWLYLACHISSLATRSQDAGWKLFTHEKKTFLSKQLQALACAQFH